jgi:hypothetical protein
VSADFFDPETGEVKVPDLGEGECGRCAAERSIRERIQSDLGNAQKEILSLLRKINGLESKIRAELDDSPEAPIMRTILQAWLHATGRNPKRTKFGEKRKQAVRAMLKLGYDADFILRAVTVGVKAANAVPAETQKVALIRVMEEAVGMVTPEQAERLRAIYREAMRDVKVYDDLELICRNEVTLERFHAFADRIDPPADRGPAS